MDNEGNNSPKSGKNNWGITWNIFLPRVLFLSISILLPLIGIGDFTLPLNVGKVGVSLSKKSSTVFFGFNCVMPQHMREAYTSWSLWKVDKVLKNMWLMIPAVAFSVFME